ncbi:MAG TPA: redoxin domain-containing protein [Gemmataceae bacterium]|jgi:peroxiredoxin
MRRFRSLALLGLLLPLTAAAGEPDRVAPFTLPDADGKPWTMPDATAAPVVVVVFTGTACPVANAYMPTLAKLHAEYAPKGVAFVAVNSVPTDDARAVAAHAAKHKLPFPALKDDKQTVAGRFGAETTPEAFVLDHKRAVRYRGRIDDQFGIGYRRPAPTRRDLAAALDELLAGKPVTVPRTEVEGCELGRTATPAEKPTVTYSKDVARIVQAKCQDCHRPGQIGPMPLMSADDLSAWAPTIKRVVRSDRMPPWHADPHFGHFANDRRLSAAEKQTLLAWIEQGCPPGDPKDLPPAKSYPDGWRIGTPDVVVTMPDAYQVPATVGSSGIAYQYIQVPTHFDHDVWVQAAEAKPGAKEVVHHIVVYALKPGEGRPRGEDRVGQNLLVAYAPGDLPSVYAPGQAKKVPKGSVLLFQLHYTPDGTPREDRSSVGLIFAKEPPKYEVRSRAVMNPRFVIPAGADGYEVKSAATFHQDTTLVNLLPHMHLRGKAFKFEAVAADGTRETLLSVPRYDFNWQSNYRPAEPVTLKAGTRLECTAWYDNSAGNKNNPDPTKPVRWGDQTWEEMMVGFVDYLVER